MHTLILVEVRILLGDCYEKRENWKFYWIGCFLISRRYLLESIMYHVDLLFYYNLFPLGFFRICYLLDGGSGYKCYIL